MSTKFAKFYDRGEYLINTLNILMIESSGNYIKVFFESSGKIEIILPLGRLNKIKVLDENFARINRFNIVNKKRITLIKDNEIVFDNGFRKILKGSCKLRSLNSE